MSRNNTIVLAHPLFDDDGSWAVSYFSRSSMRWKSTTSRIKGEGLNREEAIKLARNARRRLARKNTKLN